MLDSARSPWIVYCGHKNVPVRLSLGRGVQVNGAQPLQYPAGYLTVEAYRGALVHRFEPIESEALRNYSLRMLERGGSPAFRPRYRYGSLDGRSFVFRY